MRVINGIAVRDTLEELVDLKSTALVVIDMQNDFCHVDGHFAKYGKDLSSIEAIIPGVVRFVSRASRSAYERSSPARPLCLTGAAIRRRGFASNAGTARALITRCAAPGAGASWTA